MNTQSFYSNVCKGDKIIEDYHIHTLDLITDEVEFLFAIKDTMQYNTLFAMLQVANKSFEQISSLLDEFVVKKRIIKFLVDKGYLYDPAYSCLVQYSKDSTEKFYLNVSALARNSSARKELESYFEDKVYRAYIAELFDPSENSKCPFSGTYSFSPTAFSDEDAYAKSLINSSQYEKYVKPIYESGDTITALKAKHQLECGCKVPTVTKSIEELLDEFKQNNRVEVESDATRITRKLLNSVSGDEYEVFETEKYGTVVWRRSCITQYCYFYDCCIVDVGRHNISLLLDVPEILVTGEDALLFAYRTVEFIRNRGC